MFCITEVRARTSMPTPKWARRSTGQLPSWITPRGCLALADAISRSRRRRGGGGEVAAPRGVARRRRGPRLQGGGLRAGPPHPPTSRKGGKNWARLDALRRRGGARAPSFRRRRTKKNLGVGASPRWRGDARTCFREGVSRILPKCGFASRNARHKPHHRVADLLTRFRSLHCRAGPARRTTSLVLSRKIEPDQK